MIFQNKKYKKIITGIILTLFLIISIIFLTYQMNEDDDQLDEKYRFSQYVVNNFEGKIMGDQYGILSFHIASPKIGFAEEEDNVSNEKIGLVVSEYPLESKENLIQYIKNRNIDYLIIDDKKDNRYLIFEDVFQNELDYKYLEKQFDSTENFYKKLNVKVFKINKNALGI